ncbi:MAG: symmetrical bis(5'-nucleosyl)-tetraphosphatase [Alphaproteobacteria bacterium CG_4_10_14_0_2_um_filter_63_37]|nr:MAG: hypothetical protein AUJ55_03210 [Proteobacteria bacterium CG1_02_64_396]PJA23835.1 MAG: symmetrical bis(5'-nucleosyl)-tetraphosphatase [Alphaproteobacteria bacterium CG_4_10_14_0_2_um_filter_63_37]
MSVIAIGDLHGCRERLEVLLGRLNFDPAVDTLWLTGDVVGRGPDALGVLRLLRDLQDRVVAVMGNHEPYLIALAAGLLDAEPPHALRDLLNAPDAAELLAWVQQRPLVHIDRDLGWGMIHAGLHPDWDVAQVAHWGKALTETIQGPNGAQFCADQVLARPPERWEDCHDHERRLHFALAVFTRTRLIDPLYRFHWPSKPPHDHPARFLPWFDLPERRWDEVRWVFGHWAARGLVQSRHVLGLDSGCIWRGSLSAARLGAGAPEVVSVPCPEGYEVRGHE